MLKVIELFAGIGAQCKALQKANIDFEEYLEDIKETK